MELLVRISPQAAEALNDPAVRAELEKEVGPVTPFDELSPEEREAWLSRAVEQQHPSDSPSPSAPKAPLEDIKPRQHFSAKVTRTDLGGAFLDLGNGVEGYIHISQFSAKGSITRVADAVKPGDEMDVFVMSVNQSRKRVDLTQHKPPTYDWSNLEIGQKIEHVRVVAVESFGAFVDFDGPKHALLPYNLMPKGDRPKVGQILDVVWVMEADEGKRRVGLTMIEPPKLPWEKIKRGDKLTGTVARIERNGAYVDVGAEREGLLSSKSFGSGWVNVGDFVSVGEQVNVKVASVDPSRKRLDLTLEGLKSEDFALSSGPDEVVSPFAAALQRAQRGGDQYDDEDAPDRNTALRAKKQQEQQDALNRTLQQMQASKK